ncbi:MAG: anthranilate phosphoribosyltransferase, partial [Butyrivibrio sp.]|nr:anthranilate phosphoribosyltransferase [Butyrivibrio sp.]
NAEMTKAVLNGEKGPRRDTVLMNAGAALYVAGKAASIADGVKLAAETIDSGKALAQLGRFVELTNR